MITAEELAKQFEELSEAAGNDGELDRSDVWREAAAKLRKFIQSRAAGVQGAANPAAEAIQYHNAVGPIDAIYAAFPAMDNNDTPLEEWGQATADDGVVELVAYAIASADSNNYFFDHYCELAKAAILAHPSPAHAGAGAEALERIANLTCSSFRGVIGDPSKTTWTFSRAALETFARRLAGGDHA